MTTRKSFYKDKLRVEIFGKKEDMGQDSASFVAGKLNQAIKDKGHANLILGTGASQYPLHEVLLKKKLYWTKINLFHLDEYIGLSDQHPASFRKFLKERIADKVNPKNVCYIKGDADDINGRIGKLHTVKVGFPGDPSGPEAPEMPVPIDKNARLLDASDPKILTSEIKENEIHLYKAENQHGNWLDCIKSRKLPISTAEIGHRSGTVCLLSDIAMKLSRKLFWDPQKERFINDDEANVMLSRPQRSPYGTNYLKL